MSKHHKHMTDEDATAVLLWVETAHGPRLLTPGHQGAPTGEDEAAAMNRRNDERGR